MIRLLRTLTVLLIAALPARVAAQPAPVSAEAASGHPALIMKQAGTAFQAGRRDEATFLFYFGQLRYRARLILAPDTRGDGDGALFASLMETIGRPVNGHAYGDVPALLKIIERVLAADRSLPAPDLASPQGRRAQEAARKGLRELANHIRANRDMIRQQRQENGLENRN